MGFFLVLVMEQITLAYKEQSEPPPREETRALLGTVNGGPQHWHDGLGVPQAGGWAPAPKQWEFEFSEPVAHLHGPHTSPLQLSPVLLMKSSYLYTFS